MICSVRYASLYSLLLSVFWLVASSASAQVAPLAPPALDLSPRSAALSLTAPGHVDTPSPAPGRGSLAAEIGSSLLGELLGMGISAALVLPNACIDCDELGPRDERARVRGAIAVGHIARPVIVGGFTALGGHLSGGEGKAGMAMAGAIPGTLITGLSWLLASEDADLAPFAVLQAVGHVATVAGSVAAYRYSSRFVVSERMARALRYAPSPMIDRQRGIAGLSISGSF